MGNRTIITVFKVLGMSVILMVVLDTALMMFDAFSTLNKIQTVADTIQQDISRQNCLTTQAETIFDTALSDLDARSNVFSNIVIKKTGLADSLSPTNVKNYGDLHKLEITAQVHPLVYSIQGTTTDSWLKEVALFYEMKFEYDVPCLRYLK